MSSEQTRVLITGGTGTLGRALVKDFVAAGILPVVLTRQSASPEPIAEGAQWMQGDLVTGEGLRDALHGIDHVVHVATLPAKGPFRHDSSADVLGTRRLIHACQDTRMEWMLYVSVVGIEAVPIAYYRSKLEAEALVKNSKLPVRPSPCYPGFPRSSDASRQVSDAAALPYLTDQLAR